MPVLQDPLDSLLGCWEQRTASLSQPLLSLGHENLSQGLEEQIFKFVVNILDSRDARHAACLLRDRDALYCLDAVQHVLRNASLPSPEYASNARRLMLKLSEASEKFPSSLRITGVSRRDEHATFYGGFGDIFPASHQGNRVALKRLRIFTGDAATSHRTRSRFCKETLIWEGLHHPFILPFLGVDSDTFPSALCMVSPWMKNGTVLEYLESHGRGEVDRLLLETAEGLRYLHSMNIVHGDLRGNNILISDDFSVCLSDFGLANIICDSETTVAASSSNHAGSTRWFAPELIRPTAFGCDRFIRTPASDMYAFGCVCYELYTGAPPFSDVAPDMAAMLKVMEGERPGKPAQISDALWIVITAAWGGDWHQRPSAAEIIASFPVSTPAHLQIEQSKSSDNDIEIQIPVSDSGHHTQVELASDFESSSGTSIQVAEEDLAHMRFPNAVPTGAQAIHIPKIKPPTGSLRLATSIEMLDPLDLDIVSFVTSNKSEQEYLPPLWSSYIHPEGSIYFAREGRIRVVTDAYLYDPDILERTRHWIDHIERRLSTSNILIQPGIELFVKPMGEDCAYWSAEELGLPEDISRSGLKLFLEELYWSHVERFPMHLDPLLTQVLDEVIGIFSPENSHSSCGNDPLPFSFKQDCKASLPGQNQGQGNMEKGRNNWNIARLCKLITKSAYKLTLAASGKSGKKDKIS
ncbi:hypothetical protein MVEN_00200700 [Mycena venus]|uniref:Protein kinase domain-containing protein n=1 Tax=Mycena venus TaxID=2733690 RepID=A0A8H7DEN7_9AGAR|nr:hypothetical protein MVEN_00200700 [Mycena venus]